MAYTTIDDPSAYFQIALYTGNGSTNAITNDGNSDLQPDWIWIKNASAVENHHVYDSTRGTTKRLYPDLNFDEDDNNSSNFLQSFNTDGFTVGTDAAVNGNGNSVVGWQWKANGGTTSSNSDGSITSTVQANTTAGFSIITYTGTGSNATIGHGLGSAPTMVIVKNRSSVESWMVGHHKNSNGFQSALFLDLTAAKDTDAVYFNNTAPSSTVVSIGTNTKINHASENHVMYAFAEKQGYSSFGSFTGTGSTNGPMVFCGFKPAWVMFKNTGAAEESVLYDTKRNSTNPNTKTIRVDSNIAEAEATTLDVDFLSNGFKIRSNQPQLNSSGVSYIYMAFAESPFVSSEGVPTTAR